jgi:hypothetical protein
VLDQAKLNGGYMLAGIEPQTKAAITGSKEEYSCLTVMHDRLVVNGDYGRVKAFMAEYLLDFDLIAKSARRMVSI